MASKRRYAYYIKGNKLAIIEQGSGAGVCSISGYNNKTDCEANSGTWTDNATGTDDGKYRSPVVSIDGGIQLEYAYSPWYEYQDSGSSYTLTSTGTPVISLISKASSGGNHSYLQLKFYGTDKQSDFTVGDYIILRDTEDYNGAHKISASAFVTDTTITLETRCYKDIQPVYTGTVYYKVDFLEDEDSELQVHSYLEKALVNYVKARLLEDKMELDGKEYFMREFRRMVERHNSAKINATGTYRVQGFGLN